MDLQTMTDQQFEVVADAAVDIQYLIVKSGGMATKTKVEDVLMGRYQLSRGDAHTIVNFVESRQDFTVGSGRIRWQANRPEPQPQQYPQMEYYREKA